MRTTTSTLKNRVEQLEAAIPLWPKTLVQLAAEFRAIGQPGSLALRIAAGWERQAEEARERGEPIPSMTQAQYERWGERAIAFLEAKREGRQPDIREWF